MEMMGCQLVSDSSESVRHVSFEPPGCAHLDHPINKRGFQHVHSTARLCGGDEMEMRGCQLVSGSRESVRQVSFESPGCPTIGHTINNTCSKRAEPSPMNWWDNDGYDGVSVGEWQQGKCETSEL